MNKKEWEKALKALDELLTVAKNNMKLASVQVEELEFNISNYKKKISELK